jgi:DNA-binding transcriptional regulator LsrR (DeoR family)
METMLQPKITGYRQLSQEEVALMNEAKAIAEQCGAFIEKLRLTDVAPTLDQRWISIGATQLQQGFMAVTRGIAQPTTF